MTKEHEASRTLVKSLPELWAECSDPASLARHLGEFGEITITRLEPESAVAWEGEHASGTVRIEPSGWGTRVTLTAQPNPEAPEVEAAQVKEAGGAPEADDVEEVRPVSSDPEPPLGEEENHAAVEETVEDAEAPELALAKTSRTRARWRRVTARMRGLFSVTEGPEASGVDASVDPPSADRVPEPELVPEATAEPVPEEEPVGPQPEPRLDAEAILASALDSLGQAHHRPFSRA